MDVDPFAPGTYLVQVWARNAASGTAYDAWRQAGGSIGNPRPLTVTVDKPNPIGAAAGQPVTWTATNVGRQWPLYVSVLGVRRRTVARGRGLVDIQPVGVDPPSPGTYSFQVWVRNAGSSARLDAFQSFGPYTAVRPAAPAATSLTADYASPMPAGTPITWTATASGGTGPYTYQFWISNGSTSTIGRAWSTTPTWTWIPSTPGTYSVQVWIRNAGSAAQYNARRDADPYTIENPTPLVVTGVVSDRTFPVPQDTPRDMDGLRRGRDRSRTPISSTSTTVSAGASDATGAPHARGHGCPQGPVHIRSRCGSAMRDPVPTTMPIEAPVR